MNVGNATLTELKKNDVDKKQLGGDSGDEDDAKRLLTRRRRMTSLK